MKRARSLILVFVMCISLCACGSDSSEGPSFESKAALLDYISGMWLVDDLNKDTYYVIHDGAVYFTNKSTYESAVEQLLQKTLETEGLDAWKNMDYQKTCGALDGEVLLLDPLENVYFQYQKGIILMDEGKASEKRIVVRGSDVELVEGDNESGVSLKKIADQPPFTVEEFEEIFNQVKKECTAPSSMFLPHAEAYGEYLQNCYAQVRDWPVVSNNEDSLIKSLDGTMDANYGYYVLTDSMVTIALGEKDVVDGYPYVLMYNTGDNNSLIIMDSFFSDLQTGLAFVNAATQAVPGALTDEQVYDLYMKERVLAGDLYKLEKTVGAISYTIFEGTKWPDLDVTVMVTVADTISLAPYLNAPNSGKQTETLPSENTQPATESIKEPDAPTQTQPTEGGLDQLLIPSKIWSLSWTDDYGVTWSTDYVFDGQGNFKMLLLDGFHCAAKFQGTYTIDGNTVCIFNELSNETEQYVYDYHPEDGTWEQKSVTGFAYDHEKGDVFPLHENTDMTVGRFSELYDTYSPEEDWD